VIQVLMMRPVLTAKRRGIVVGDAYMSDGQTLRFRVLAIDPVAVRLVGEELPEHQAAIEAFIAEHRAPRAA
jgi:hypothetical protein